MVLPEKHVREYCERQTSDWQTTSNITDNLQDICMNTTSLWRCSVNILENIHQNLIQALFHAGRLLLDGS